MIQNKHLLCTFRQTAVALIITVMRLMTEAETYWYLRQSASFTPDGYTLKVAKKGTLLKKINFVENGK